MRDIIPFISLVLAECRFAPLEPKAPQPTSDFHAEKALSPGMIPQPEKRVHVAALGVRSESRVCDPEVDRFWHIPDTSFSKQLAI